ncbi:MAG: flagellar basal body rod protein FlgB [bacterium]|nr:flagellar basal body rod protein FlgB [bacterium]
MSQDFANIIFAKSGVPKLKKYLDLTSVNHRLTSSNVANVSTPGYKSSSIDFQQEFNKATGESRHIAGKITDNNHIALGQHPDRAPKIDRARVQAGEMNSVDIDTEMSNLAKTELQFSTAAKLLQLKFQGLRKAITSK